jgi:hypothetical protein
MDLRSHLIFYSGKEIEKRESGVAFMADKFLKGNILDFKHVTDYVFYVSNPNRLKYP